MNKHLYFCHPLVPSSPTLMMHGHTNLKFDGFKEPVILTSVTTNLSVTFNLLLCLNVNIKCCMYGPPLSTSEQTATISVIFFTKHMPL